MDSVLVVRAIHRNGTYERRGSGGAGWQVSHERVLSFARRRAGLDWEEGRLPRGSPSRSASAARNCPKPALRCEAAS